MGDKTTKREAIKTKSAKSAAPSDANKMAAASDETVKTRPARSSAPTEANKMAAVNNEPVLAAIEALGVTMEGRIEALRVTMEGRMDVIDASFLALQNEHRASEKRMDEMDIAITDVHTRVSSMERTSMDVVGWVAELREENIVLKAKLDDLEGRSRRCNIRIVGITEGEEGERPAEFVSRLVTDLLGPGGCSKPIKVDRAHRSLKARPPPTANPRVIIAKLHNDRDVAAVFRCSQEKKQLFYKGRKMFIFPDYTADVSSRRQAFGKVKRRLVDGGAKCMLKFPAKLHVMFNNVATTYDGPADAEAYADSMKIPELPPLRNAR